MHYLAKFIYFKLMGWKMKGDFPDIDQCVVIVIPHTHWLDFPLGLIVRKVVNKEINYIGKKSLFNPPFGWFFKKMGGTPVDRSSSNNLVEAVAKIFEKKKVFRIALAPEGTRKKVETLKTGFYYISKLANVPIIMVAFDFGKKEVKIAEPMYPSNNQEVDFEKVNNYYRGVHGKIPKNSYLPDDTNY